MYLIKIRPSLDEKFNKLASKDKKSMEIISKKIQEVIQNPQHYKNLRFPLQHLKRVHIGKSHVLIFSVERKK